MPKTDDEVPMPSDWDDHAGWDKHYQAEVAQASPEHAPGPWSSVKQLASCRFLTFALSLNPEKRPKVWFTGVGLDNSSFVYALAGCHVVATDVSQTAIEFLKEVQSTGASIVEDTDEMVRELEIESAAIGNADLSFEVHDFRERSPHQDFDLVVNVKAFQALPGDSLDRASRTFFNALRPGGYAIFDTQNVQGERRDRLENSLIGADFHLPGHKAEVWLREQMRATGIPYIMVLGQPFPNRYDSRYKGRKGEKLAEQDQITLRSFNVEYRRLLEEEMSREQASPDDQRKTAYMIYNTG